MSTNLLCPVCKESLSKKFWSRTQWTKKLATVQSELLNQHFNCCKNCSPTYNSDGLPAACGALDKQRKTYEAKKKTEDHEKVWHANVYRCKQEQCQSHLPTSSQPGKPIVERWLVGDVSIYVFLKPSEQDAGRKAWPPADTISIKDPKDLDMEFSVLLLKKVPQNYVEELLKAMLAIPKQLIQELALRWLDWSNFQGTNVKFFSHFGAIVLRETNRNACSWIHPTTKKGFSDPTNRVYSMVIEQFWPHLPQGRNVETQGDILEALFGFGFILEEELKTPLDLKFRDFLEALDIWTFYTWTKVYSEC